MLDDGAHHLRVRDAAQPGEIHGPHLVAHDPVRPVQLRDEIVEAGLQAARAPEGPRHVAEGVDFDPWLEIRPVGGRRTGVVASRGLGFKVEPRAVEEAVVPHDAAGIVDDETVQRGGEDDIAG